MTTTNVLDASALLAYLQGEQGEKVVASYLPFSMMSSVNWAEVVQKSIAAGVVIEGMREDLEALGLELCPFDSLDAQVTGQLWQQTRQYGLSLGDRACLSLGLKLSVPILTTDRTWANLGLNLNVQVIR